MKNFLFPCLLFFVSSSLFSQRIIELSYNQDAQGNVTFSAANHGWCNYILEIDFTNLTNAKADHDLPFRGEIKPGTNRLFKLSKENAGADLQFKYRINYFKGCMHPAVDTGFTYLLPIAPGTEAQAYELQEKVKITGGPDPKNAYTIRLRMKPGDTLYAARRGRVVEVDASDGMNDAGTAVNGNLNYIEIVHADCSFGRYGILRKDGALVSTGQWVEAGEPIGIIGGDSYGRGSDGRFSVFYNLMEGDGQHSGGKIWLAYVPLKFWTGKNGKGMLRHGASYISEFPEAMITREMSKAAALKWKAAHKVKK